MNLNVLHNKLLLVSWKGLNEFYFMIHSVITIKIGSCTEMCSREEPLIFFTAWSCCFRYELYEFSLFPVCKIFSCCLTGFRDYLKNCNSSSGNSQEVSVLCCLTLTSFSPRGFKSSCNIIQNQFWYILMHLISLSTGFVQPPYGALARQLLGLLAIDSDCKIKIDLWVLQKVFHCCSIFPANLKQLQVESRALSGSFLFWLQLALQHFRTPHVFLLGMVY